MSDLIKSITTTEISGDDVLKEVFDTAVETIPDSNDLLLSYNPTSQTLGKSTFPALQQQVLPVDLRALKIDKAINSVPPFSTTAPIVYTVDLTAVQELNVISLSITQFHTVVIAGATELVDSKEEQLNGVRNEYLIFYKGAKLYYARSYGQTPPYDILFEKVFDDLNGFDVNSYGRVSIVNIDNVNYANFPGNADPRIEKNNIGDIAVGDVLRLTLSKFKNVSDYVGNPDLGIAISIDNRKFVVHKADIINDVYVLEITAQSNNSFFSLGGLYYDYCVGQLKIEKKRQ